MPENHEVVLIEDDEGMRRAIERILGGCGYHVDAYDSAEALQDALGGEALWETCRCLISDVRLPLVSGFELHRRLAERGVMPPSIFITAYDDAAVRRQADRAVAAYLLKPFAGRALVALVKHAMQPH